MKADPAELRAARSRKVVRTDGLKLILDDGSWVCYRLVRDRAGGAGLYGGAVAWRHGALGEAAKDWALQ